jgi:hypothetical protein
LCNFLKIKSFTRIKSFDHFWSQILISDTLNIFKF